MFLDPSKEIERRRHKLPHWQQETACICATWRTADSLPRTVLDHWNEQRAIWLSLHPQPWDEATDLEYYERFASEMDEHLDRGYGACPLRESGNARVVADALRHFDGDRYELSDFVVMPNHVHVLFAPGTLPVYGPLKVRGFGFIDSGCHLLVNLLPERRPEAAA